MTEPPYPKLLTEGASRGQHTDSILTNLLVTYWHITQHRTPSSVPVADLQLQYSFPWLTLGHFKLPLDGLPPRTVSAVFAFEQLWPGTLQACPCSVAALECLQTALLHTQHSSLSKPFLTKILQPTHRQ